jgi:hypothetical protein
MNMILNRKDIIIAVGNSWNNEVIRGEQAPFSAQILDKPLFSFIQGDLTKISVNTILMRARSLKKQIIRRYRCDELRMRHYCEMRISPLKDGELEIEHITLRVESRRLPIDINTLYSDKERDEQARRCSMCCKYKYENTWLEIEDYLIVKSMPSENFLLGNIDYGLCPKCLTDYCEGVKQTV